MRFGLDHLGLAKYPKIALKYWPDGWALGCFSSVFGDARGAVDAILHTGKCPVVRVQLAYRGSHEFSRTDFPGIVTEGEKWKALMARYPGVQWRMSGICEHRLSSKDASELRDQILYRVPGCVYVNTPEGDKGAKIDGCLNEMHGSSAKPPRTGNCSMSFDGQAVVDSDVVGIRKAFEESGRCELFFLWEPRFNGLWEVPKEGEPRTPIEGRVGWPDADGKLIRSVVALIGECGSVGLPKNWLYKSHSENPGDGDVRAEKPVMIAPVKVEAITIGGHVMRRYVKPYHDGRWRYYATKWGFEIGSREAGSLPPRGVGTKPVPVKIGSQLIGHVNPAFRYSPGEWK